MLDFFNKLFKPAPPSGATAKERLRLVLLSDHLSLAPDVIEALKRDLLVVISRYVEIDQAHADVTFEHREGEVAMLASIPITGVRDRVRAEEPPHVPQTPATATPAVMELPLRDESPAEAVTPASALQATAADAPAEKPASQPNAAAPRRRRRRKSAAAKRAGAQSVQMNKPAQA